MIGVLYLILTLNLHLVITEKSCKHAEEHAIKSLRHIHEDKKVFEVTNKVESNPQEQKISKVILEPYGFIYPSKEKSDRDTFKYDNGTNLTHLTLSRVFAMFPILRHRPGYSSPDSTFILTFVMFAVFYPRANAVCSIFVYDKYFSLRRSTTLTFNQNIDGVRWYTVPINPPVNLYDTFTIVLYLPVEGSNNCPLLDASPPIDTLTGFIRNDTLYYLTTRDLLIRAIGHFEQIHDVSAWEMVFPTRPYRVAEPESLVWRVYNFGNFNETSVPVTVALGTNSYNLNISVPRKDYIEISTSQPFTVSGEGLLGTTFWTSLSNDYDKTNDTFPEFYIYFFPKHTPYTEDFDFIPSLSYAGWTVVNNDGGNQRWFLAYSRIYSNSGWRLAASRYESSTLRNDDWLISPVIKVHDTCATAVGFRARARHASYPESLEVWIMNGTSPSDTIEALYKGRLTTTYNRFTYSLDRYRGQEIRIGFRNRGLDQFYIFLDDYYVRQVPLPPGCALLEEFEEMLTPAGWSTEGNLWVGGSPLDAGVSDAGTGNVFYFLSSSTPGSTSTLYSPVFKTYLPNNRVSYRFLYHNASGNDSLQVWLRVDNGSWQYISTYFTTDAWDTIIGGPIIVDGKGTYNLQFRFVGYADGGNSNIAIDNVEIYSDIVTDHPENNLKPALNLKTVGRSITIELTGIKKGVQVSIYDVSGRTILQKKINRDDTISIQNLKAGVYLLVVDGDIKISQKVIHLR